MNPFQRLFDALLRFVRDLVTALVSGVLRAPVTALENAVPEIEVREAKASEVVDVRHAVLRAGRPRTDAIWPGDDEGRHWIARHRDRTIGVVTVMPRPHPADGRPGQQLRGMAVLEDWQGKGIGSALLAAVHRDLAEPMWCNARIRAVSFYERHGWSVTSETFDIEGVGPHRRMQWSP